MSLYAFLFFCRVYFIAYIASNGVGPHVLPTPQDTKHKSQNTKLESQKFETQNSKHPYTKHNVPYRLPYSAINDQIVTGYYVSAINDIVTGYYASAINEQIVTAGYWLLCLGNK